MSQDPNGIGYRWRVGFAGVVILAAALFFLRIGERALWSEEIRWAEIPREMERSGDYWWPTFNGRVYYDKPLGSYWLVLAAARLTGGIDELRLAGVERVGGAGDVDSDERVFLAVGPGDLLVGLDRRSSQEREIAGGVAEDDLAVIGMDAVFHRGVLEL